MPNSEREFDAYFEGRPSDTRDKAAIEAVKYYGGRIVASGTNLITGVRDIQVRCEASVEQPLREALRKVGLRFEP